MGQPYFGFVIKKDSTVLATGLNNYGQLGLNDKNNRIAFTEVAVTDAESVIGGTYHAMILKKDGTLWGAGYNFTGCLGLGVSGTGTDKLVFNKIDIDNIKQVGCGGDYTIVLKNDGTLWATGGNRYGQIGLGNVDSVKTFTKVDIDNISSIYCGYSYVMLLKKDGTLWTTGSNDFGQLGLDDLNNRKLFEQVDIENVEQVYCGSSHTMILKKDGTLWACGRNYYGQLGLGNKGTGTDRKVFTQVGIDNVKKVYCGGNHTLVEKKDGTLWACGSNQYGQLGLGDNGATTDRIVFTKVDIDNIKQVSCGDAHTMLLKNDGSVWVCGSNQFGQIGVNDKSDRNIFTKVDIEDVESLYNKEITSVYYYNILKNNNKYVVFSGSGFEELGDVLPTSEVFKEKGMTDLSVLLKQKSDADISKPIEDLGDTFEILTYSEDDSSKQLNVKALPNENQLVIPTEDININSIENIHQTKVSIKGNDGFIKIVVSCDSGTTWKTFKDGTWSDIALDKTVIRKMGMSNVEMESITMDNWNEIINNDNKVIRFAFLLGKNSVDSVCDIDEISLVMDMKGTWKSSNYGTDYTYKYPNNMLLQVEIKNNGDYKINYGGRKGRRKSL